jgi:hypothetical protein
MDSSDNLAIPGLRPSSLCSFGPQLGVHQATGVARLLQFPVEAVPQTFLAIPDQADVG